MRKYYPWIKDVNSDLAVCWATLWGLGTLRASGTWGSALGVLFYCIFFYGMGLPSMILILGALAYLSAGICDVAEESIGETDPSMVNLDEFIAMPLCFLPIVAESFSGLWLLLGFAIFRVLDIKKPLFINKLQSVEGGVGIMLDDLVAALATSVILNITYYYL